MEKKTMGKSAPRKAAALANDIVWNLNNAASKRFFGFLRIGHPPHYGEQKPPRVILYLTKWREYTQEEGCPRSTTFNNSSDEESNPARRE